MSKLRKFNIYNLLMALLVGGIVLSNYIWLRIDEYPVEGHGLIGVIPAVQVYRELKGLGNTYKYYDRIFGTYNGMLHYPPLSYIIVVLFYLLFGLQGQMVVMVNSLYIAVTLICVYLMGKHIFNERMGLLSAFILSSFPGFIGFSRVYWIEFGLMSLVCLDLYLLLKTGLFDSRWYSILLGLSIFLSGLFLFEFIIFIIGPLLLVISESGIIKDIFKAKWTRRVRNFILVIALGIIPSSFWWTKYVKNILTRALFFKYQGLPYIWYILSPASLIYSFIAIALFINPFFFTYLFLSMPQIIRMGMIKEKNWMRFNIKYFSLAFFVPVVILTFIRVKHSPILLPMLPSIALLCPAGLFFLKNRAIKATLISLIVVYCLNLHLCTFYSSKKLKATQAPQIFNAWNNYILHCRSRHPATRIHMPFFSPRREYYEFAIKEILGYLSGVGFNGKELPKVLVVWEEGREAFRHFTFEYYSLVGNYKFKFFPLHRRMLTLSEFDYIIVEEKDSATVVEGLTKDFTLEGEDRRYLRRIFKDGHKDFDLIKVYKIHDGDTSAFIYKKHPSDITNNENNVAQPTTG